MAEPKFVRFVSSVTGRLVSRWDAPVGYIGARQATPEERAQTGEPFVWNEEAVIPLTVQFCARYARELHNALRAGDLKSRTEAEWRQYVAALEAQERAHVEALEKAEAEAQKAAELPGPTPPNALPESPDANGVVLEAPALAEEPVEVASATVEPGGPAASLELEDGADAPKGKKRK